MPVSKESAGTMATTEKKPLGCLLLHGFTSHINCIDPLEPRVKKLGLPYRMPVLRGHGTKASDLEGVVWRDWLEDGEKALHELLQECDKVVPVALSMGSLVGLNLAVKYPEKMAGIVCIAPALKSKSRLAPFAPVVARLQKQYKFKPDPLGYYDQEAFKTNQNYMEVPSAAIVEFLKFAKYTYSPNLSRQIKIPIQIIASANDRTIDNRTAQWLYDTVSSPVKELRWFQHSGHEMLRDAEKEQILDLIEGFLARLNKEAAEEKISNNYVK